MPNWVYNRVHGSKKVCEALLGEDRKPTFTKIIPTPKELKRIEGLEDCSLYNALVSYVYKGDNLPLLDLFNTRNMSKDYKTLEDWALDLIDKQYPISKLRNVKNLEEEYGVTNWYDFNCKYFGCKWDACNTSEYPEETDCIEFDTPWDAPTVVMEALASKFPDEIFTWHCDEESGAFSYDRNYLGHGTYVDEDVFPECYTPYIPEECDLVSACEGIENMTDLKDQIKSLYPKDCNYDLQEDDGYLTITVYDWPALGGDTLYSHTFNLKGGK